jgi:hypothetical protein
MTQSLLQSTQRLDRALEELGACLIPFLEGTPTAEARRKLVYCLAKLRVCIVAMEMAGGLVNEDPLHEIVGSPMKLGDGSAGVRIVGSKVAADSVVLVKRRLGDDEWFGRVTELVSAGYDNSSGQPYGIYRVDRLAGLPSRNRSPEQSSSDWPPAQASRKT